MHAEKCRLYYILVHVYSRTRKYFWLHYIYALPV